MKFRALIKQSGDWWIGWIGWLIDIPGVSAQEKSKEEVLESQGSRAEDRMATEVPFVPDAQVATIEIAKPKWASSPE